MSISIFRQTLIQIILSHHTKMSEITIKTPKRKRNSVIARTYLQNLKESNVTQSNAIIPIEKKKTNKKHPAINIVTETAKITLSNTDGNNFSVDEIQNILDDTDDMNGCKVVTEEEFKLIRIKSQRNDIDEIYQT